MRAWSVALTLILTLVAIPASAQSRVEQGVDFYGGDIASFAPPVPGWGACESACYGNPQCRAFTYTRPTVGEPTGRCYLKSTNWQRRVDACCDSGVRRGPPNQPGPGPGGAIGAGVLGGFTTEEGVDYYGGDLSGFLPEHPNHLVCRNACAGDGRCVAYTYTRPLPGEPNGRCYLKSSFGERRTNPCCISGRRQLGELQQGVQPSLVPQVPAELFAFPENGAGGAADQPAPQLAPSPPVASVPADVFAPVVEGGGPSRRFTRETGVDYFGGDLYDLVVDDANHQACARACADESRCVAFTFLLPRVGEPFGRCYLKSVIAERRTNPCCVSGTREGVSSIVTAPAPQPFEAPPIAEPPVPPSGDALTSLLTPGQIAGAALASGGARQSLLFADTLDTPRQVLSARLFLPGAADFQDLEYELVDGMAVLEDDIVLGEPATLADKYRPPPPPAVVHVTPHGDIGSRTDPLMATNRVGHLWPGGIMPYTISDDFTPGQRATILAAIDALNNAGTPLRVVPRAGHADYVHFVTARSCRSHIGRQGGRQRIWLKAGDRAIDEPSCWEGEIIHEMLHAAGVWHEQSRSDRNQHVRILWDNIKLGKRHNFRQRSDRGMNLSPYDIDSIMHYGATDFGKPASFGGRLPTIVRVNGEMFESNRRGLSPGDIAGLNILYADPGDAIPPTNRPRILTAAIDRLVATSADSCNERMDFYAEVEIGPGWDWRRGGGGGIRRSAIVEGNDIRPSWRFDAPIPADETRARVDIRIMDEDDFVCGQSDDIVDVHPAPAVQDLSLAVDLASGSVHLGLPVTQWNRVGALGDSLVFQGTDGVETGAVQFRLLIR